MQLIETPVGRGASSGRPKTGRRVIHRKKESVMNLKTKIAAVVATSLISGWAFAAASDPGVSTSAASYPGNVTISDEKTPSTYLAFVVTLHNNGGSAVRTVRALGTVTATAVDATGSPTASSLTAPQFNASNSTTGCFVDPDTTRAAATNGFNWRCDFDITALSGGTVSYNIVVSVPKWAVSTPPTNAQQSISLASTTSYREGSGTGSESSLTSYSAGAQAPVVEGDDSSVKTAFLKSGGNAYTGTNKGVPTPGDLHTTKVSAPGLDSFVKVEINETPAPSNDAACISARTFKTCYTTQLLIQDTSNAHVTYNLGSYLTLVIRSNTDNQQPGNPKNFVWYYKSDTGATTPINLNSEYCAKDASGNPLPNTVAKPEVAGVPCMVGPPVCYKKGTLLEGVPLLNGVCEYKFINDRNGLIRPML
jgi:hypothetical protein